MPAQPPVNINPTQPKTAPQLQTSIPQDTSTKVKKGGSPLFSIVGIVVVTIALFFGGLFYLQYLQNQNIEDNGKMEEEKKLQEELQLKQLEKNAQSDQTRKLDITSINKGLSDYFQKNKEFPEKLEVLTPDYLTVIPLDPVSKAPYSYTPNEDFTQYEILAKLSDGSDYSVKSN